MTRFDFLPAIFALWIVLSSYAQRGIEPNAESKRMLYIERFGLFMLAACSPNLWVGGLMLLPMLTWRHGPIFRNQVEPFLFTAILWAGLYVALSDHVTLAWVPWILGALVALGVLQGLWAVHTLWMRTRPFDNAFDRGRYDVTYKIGPWSLNVWELNASYQIIAGCGNPNHTQAISAMTTAAGVGLMLMGYAFVGLLLPLTALVLVVACWSRDRDGYPTAAYAYLALFPLFMGPWIWGWRGALVSSVIALIATPLLAWAYPHLLSGRTEVWVKIWREYGASPWPQQLIGAGSGSWLRARIASQKVDEYLWIQPHNEFLLMLWEHGWVGMGILLGLLSTAFWEASQAGPVGAAVCLLGAVICMCAMISSPWHPYTEVITMHPVTKQVSVIGQGQPALNVVTFACLLCLEAVTQ
jgi:hypothetical protein